MNNTMLSLISDEEREHLLSMLHRILVWVGEPLPDTVEINRENVEIHELIWSCVQERISEQERKQLINLIHSLEEKEVYNEDILKNSNITLEEAQRLYHETASLIRAITDLKTCEAGEFKLKVSRHEIENKIEDTKRWLNFMKSVDQKCTNWQKA